MGLKDVLIILGVTMFITLIYIISFISIWMGIVERIGG